MEKLNKKRILSLLNEDGEFEKDGVIFTTEENENGLIVRDPFNNSISLKRANHYMFIDNGVILKGNELRLAKIDFEARYFILSVRDKKDSKRLNNDDFYNALWKYVFPNLFLDLENRKVFLLQLASYELGERSRVEKGIELDFEFSESKLKNFIITAAYGKYDNLQYIFSKKEDIVLYSALNHHNNQNHELEGETKPLVYKDVV